MRVFSEESYKQAFAESLADNKFGNFNKCFEIFDRHLNTYRYTKNELTTPIDIRIEINDACNMDKIIEPQRIIHNVLKRCNLTLHSNVYKLGSMTMQSLVDDVLAIRKYRSECDAVSIETFKLWFPGVDPSHFFTLHTDRDFIYNQHGLRLLINRYLRKHEPIQYCMFRIAKILSNNIKFTPRTHHNIWRLMYTLVSCGFLQVSSILADSDKADERIIPGEACRLMVATKQYNREFIKQVEAISTTISLGVGVGLGVSTVPLNGTKENGQIHGGFRSMVKRFDSCNLLSIYERKPKIALYLNIHNDTILETLDLRHPAKEHVENVFFGILINDYFMTCVREKTDWYLFPGNVTYDGKYLCDFYGEQYIDLYHKFVEAKLYTKQLRAEELMDKILTALAETGSPYIIWDDNVNKFNNHKHLGKVKTLNLCAEITNYASDVEDSSCKLISCNFGMCKDFIEIQYMLYACLSQIDENFEKTCSQFENMSVQCKFAYMLGYMGTFALNNLMGVDCKKREIGISPMGVYDMAAMNYFDAKDIIGQVSEAMYLGAISSSCKFSSVFNVKCDRYINSPFSNGEPQWKLRNLKTHIQWPEQIFDNMRKGMANSMLTAQAPTATTSMLCGVTESVTLPLDVYTTKESENGRNGMITYGLMYRLLLDSKNFSQPDNSFDQQLAMYLRSAPYIDQSQSTMFNIELTKQNIFNILRQTYIGKLKTAIYYILPKTINPTLSIVRPTNNFEDHYKSKMSDKVATTSNTICSPKMAILNAHNAIVDPTNVVDPTNETTHNNALTTNPSGYASIYSTDSEDEDYDFYFKRMNQYIDSLQTTSPSDESIAESITESVAESNTESIAYSVPSIDGSKNEYDTNDSFIDGMYKLIHFNVHANIYIFFIYIFVLY